MDRDKMKEWCIAGACSVAIHAFLILLFAFFGNTPSEPGPQPEPAAKVRETTPDLPASDASNETNAPAATTSPPEPRTRTYKVKPGDTLISLARNARTTTEDLARLNGVDEKEFAKLKVGQTIKLPAVD